MGNILNLRKKRNERNFRIAILSGRGKKRGITIFFLLLLLLLDRERKFNPTKGKNFSNRVSR